jgi:hypothetical protein
MSLLSELTESLDASYITFLDDEGETDTAISRYGFYVAALEIIKADPVSDHIIQMGLEAHCLVQCSRSATQIWLDFGVKL